MDGFSYNESWPDALKDAERQRYRACCKVRCLEASLDRIDWSEFEAVMNELEAARAEVLVMGKRAFGLRVAWLNEKENRPRATNTGTAD